VNGARRTIRHVTIPRVTLAWDTLVDVDVAGPGPLHERLTRALRQAIRDGRLPPGAALPPSRTLAADLDCSRWVVTQAYGQLVAEGYLTARTGSATRVRELRPTSAVGSATSRPSGGTQPIPGPGGTAARHGSAPLASASTATVFRLDFAPGLSDLRAFPRRQWLEAVRSQLATLPYSDLGYPPEGGCVRFRWVLADYLRRCRGAQADGDDVTCCAGVADGVARLACCLRDAGIHRIAVEDPGWTKLRQTLERVGLETVGVPVDEQGIRVDELTRLDVRAVLVTPAHQFPTGVVLTPERRTALLAWARHVDGLVLEDDYDAEFRYDRRPVGTLQGTDPERVALFGSLSKTLSPAIGLGWMVTPPRWTRALRASEAGQTQPPVLQQLTFAHFVESGGYDRHLRSVRQRYRRRRDALVAAIQARLPECALAGVAAGLHIVLHLPPSTRAAAVVRNAADVGVRVADLDTYRITPNPASPGLVLGYGNLPDSAVDEAVGLLATAVHWSIRP
jgi:GntR family transcriptional regulator/MocR family aminotransferase